MTRLGQGLLPRIAFDFVEQLSIVLGEVIEQDGARGGPKMILDAEATGSDGNEIF